MIRLAIELADKIADSFSERFLSRVAESFTVSIPDVDRLIFLSGEISASGVSHFVADNQRSDSFHPEMDFAEIRFGLLPSVAFDFDDRVLPTEPENSPCRVTVLCAEPAHIFEVLPNDDVIEKLRSPRVDLEESGKLLAF